MHLSKPLVAIALAGAMLAAIHNAIGYLLIALMIMAAALGLLWLVTPRRRE
ncbi:hypothetical protein [Celeribacter sp.]|uniref:hypothetical protein n=1 Tax=Celeribacter sp. TaxID=1890673 RepID=UPI003A94924A